MSERQGKMAYEQDSKRFHRFRIETEAGITGSIYIPKDLKPMPKRLVLDYQAAAQPDGKASNE